MSDVPNTDDCVLCLTASFANSVSFQFHLPMPPGTEIPFGLRSSLMQAPLAAKTASYSASGGLALITPP